MTQRIHANELLTEMLRLFELNLLATLNLKGVYRGGLSWLPPQRLTTMVNGIWAELVQQTDIKEVVLPKGLNMTYRVRIVFVRLLDISNNVDEQRIADAEKVIEMIYDNYQMSNINSGGSNPLSNAQVLWWLPRTIEWHPPEDDFVSAIRADITAI